MHHANAHFSSTQKHKLFNYRSVSARARSVALWWSHLKVYYDRCANGQQSLTDTGDAPPRIMKIREGKEAFIEEGLTTVTGASFA